MRMSSGESYHSGKGSKGISKALVLRMCESYCTSFHFKLHTKQNRTKHCGCVMELFPCFKTRKTLWGQTLACGSQLQTWEVDNRGNTAPTAPPCGRLFKMFSFPYQFKPEGLLKTQNWQQVWAFVSEHWNLARVWPNFPFMTAAVCTSSPPWVQHRRWWKTARSSLIHQRHAWNR